MFGSPNRLIDNGGRPSSRWRLSFYSHRFNQSPCETNSISASHLGCGFFFFRFSFVFFFWGGGVCWCMLLRFTAEKWTSADWWMAPAHGVTNRLRMFVDRIHMDSIIKRLFILFFTVFFLPRLTVIDRFFSRFFLMELSDLRVVFYRHFIEMDRVSEGFDCV